MKERDAQGFALARRCLVVWRQLCFPFREPFVLLLASICGSAEQLDDSLLKVFSIQQPLGALFV